MDVTKWISEVLTQAPPAWVLWLGVSVAMLNFLVALLSFLFNKTNERRKRLNSVQDEFWFRKIAAPFFIEPYLLFLTNQQAAFESISVKDLAATTTRKKCVGAFLAEFRQAKKAVRCRLNFLKAADADTFKEISEALRDLDDKVTLFCARNSDVTDLDPAEHATKDDVIAQFEETILRSISTMKSSHRKLADA